MGRIVFMNLQKVGDRSPTGKYRNIIQTLRNFYFNPDYYAFCEVSTTWDDADLCNFGREIFAPSARCFRAAQFRYHVFGPHVPKTNSTEDETEKFGLLKWTASSGPPIQDNMLQLFEPRRPLQHGHDLRSRGADGAKESSVGVRQAALHSHDGNLDIMIYHPSPTSAASAFISFVGAVAAWKKPFIAVGDFNVRPTDCVGSEGKTAENYARDAGIRLSAPDQPTHKQGIIDYALHSARLNVTVTRLDLKGHPNSDHCPIYVDY